MSEVVSTWLMLSDLGGENGTRCITGDNITEAEVVQWVDWNWWFTVWTFCFYWEHILQCQVANTSSLDHQVSGVLASRKPFQAIDSTDTDKPLYFPLALSTFTLYLSVHLGFSITTHPSYPHSKGLESALEN